MPISKLKVIFQANAAADSVSVFVVQHTSIPAAYVGMG